MHRLLPKRFLHIATIIIFFLFTSVLFPLAQAHAYTTYSSLPTTNYDYGVQPTMHNFVQSTFIDMFSEAFCLLTGSDPISTTHECLGVNGFTGKIGYASNSTNGAIGMLSTGVDNLFKAIPAHNTTDYFALEKSHFGLAKYAYADQGSGYAGITPLLNVWVVIRNLTYTISILAFVGIGLAIMLRLKIDPRTVMTIQNQIPKIIIALIMITFSFAISGLAIDAMYATTFVFYNIYASVPGIEHNVTPSLLQSNTPFGIINYLGKNPEEEKKTPLTTLYLVNIPAVKTWHWLPFGLGGKTVFHETHLVGIPISPIVYAVSNNIPGGGVALISSSIAGSMGQTVKIMLGIHEPTFNPTDPNTPFLGGLSTFFASGPVQFILGLFTNGAAQIFGIENIMFDIHKLDPINGVIDFGSFILTNKWVDTLQNGNDLMKLAARTVLDWDLSYRIIQGGIRDVLPVLIIWLIIFISLFMSMVKLFFALLQAWLTTLFYITLGPVFILFGIIPKSKTGFGSWLKGLCVHLLAFPITAGILLFGDVFIQAFSDPKYTGQYFIPPLLGGINIPVGPLLAVATFFIAANGPAIAKGLLEFKDDRNTAGAFGAGIGGGIKMVTQTGAGISDYTAPLPGAPNQKIGWRGLVNRFTR